MLSFHPPLSPLPQIPRNLRLIYVHAYQSYVWNVMVSERVREFGADSPVEGDLVFDDDKKTEEVAADVEKTRETEDDGEMAEGNAAETEVEAAAAPSAPTGPPKSTSKKDWKTSRCHTTKILTAADLSPSSPKKWTIFDVVMPLPGFEVDLPGGRLGDMFREILKADGLDQEDVWKRQK
jgi:tRNA pseudouridine13 synthase